MKNLLILLAICTFSISEAFAFKWSGNLGIRNPPNSDIGLNFMGLANNDFAFEFGFGLPNIFDDNSSSSIGSIVDLDINVKYLFKGSTFRPYLQIGHTASIYGLIGEEFDLDLNLGSTFFGGGLFILGSSAYLYLSANRGFDNDNWFSQFGIGIYF